MNHKRRYTVTYTDPKWALSREGRLMPELASIEREAFGDNVTMRFGPVVDGRYVARGRALHEAVAGADGLVITRSAVTEELLAAAGPSLKVVCRQGVGIDNLAPDLLKERGIVGFNIPDYCVDEVAAHTVALLLALERGLVHQHRSLSLGVFDVYAGGVPRRLQNCTAGIIGLGRIGQAVALRLRLFYGRVVACDPYISADHMRAQGVEKVSFVELLKQSDTILLHCPLNEQTRGLMNADAFARVERTPYFINAARGGLVEARALWAALAEDCIAGAGIDVFSPEDPTTDEWYARVIGHPNVIVTSHRAYLSKESEISQRRRAAEGVRQTLETGCPPAIGLVTCPAEPLREASPVAIMPGP